MEYEIDFVAPSVISSSFVSKTIAQLQKALAFSSFSTIVNPLLGNSSSIIISRFNLSRINSFSLSFNNSLCP